MGQPTGSLTLALHKLPGQLFTKEDLEGEHWYDCAPEWPSEGEDGLRASVEEWKAVGEAALSSATRAYEKQAGGGRKGPAGKEQTVGDRIASLTLRVQESPLHRLDDLRTLQSLTKKKERRESAPASEALKDLFINDLLPPDRRLVSFEDQEFECGKGERISKRHVAYALYEAELKTIYRGFLKALEDFGKDNLAHFKQRAVKYISELLVAKPECEKELLAMLVNKLGDPDRKVSSTASYNLQQLVEKHHPQMRHVVVKEVEQLLMRPNVSPKAQYFAVIFLNQLKFARDEVDLARWMLRIYMHLFTSSLLQEKKPVEQPKRQKERGKKMSKKKRKKDNSTSKSIDAEVKESRLMGALLIGANRAYPYTKPEQDETSYQEHYDALFQVAHSKSLAPATQALCFLLQVSQSQSTQTDRFYRALYSRVYDAAGAGEPKQASFLNLLYKAMKADTSQRRVKAFAKRLLQAAMLGNASFAGACTVLLSECFRGKQFGTLKSFMTLAELSDEVEQFVDADKAEPLADDLENDQQQKDVKAGEDDSNSDSSEHGEASKGESGATNDHSLNAKEDGRNGATPSPREDDTAGRYHPEKRNPEFAGAESSRLWEVVALCQHFHPSVARFARSMCVQRRNVSYPGDPLKDFSLIAFLDKFSYKKPKNRVAKSLYGKRASSYRDDPLPNSREFLDLAEKGRVAEDDKFFVRFFSDNPNRISGQGAQVAMGTGDSSESEEEAFEQAMQAEMKRLGADPGFSSAAVYGAVGDVDEDDEDELEAFENAFANDLARSDEDDESDVEEDKLEGSLEVKVKRTRRKDTDAKQQKRPKTSMNSKGNEEEAEMGSVFASAEDYAEAINEDIEKQELDKSNGSADEMAKKRKGRGAIRVRSDVAGKAQKKRRLKKR